MSLELNHLGQTLAVGGFAIYAVLYLVHVCRADWVPKFFTATDGKLQVQHAAVYLALVLAAGVVLEDVSKGYAARRSSFFPETFNWVLDADNELRLRSLFTVTTLEDAAIVAEPRNIVRELQQMSPRTEAVRSYLEEIRRHNPTAEGQTKVTGEVEVEAFLRAIDGVFYEAKNLVYREETYFQELSDISDRMDFTRSLTFLCLIFSVVYFGFFLASLAPRVATLLGIDKAETRKVLGLSVLYALGIWLVGSAYRTEVNNYDLRVFGYYVSVGGSPANRNS